MGVVDYADALTTLMVLEKNKIPQDAKQCEEGKCSGRGVEDERVRTRNAG
jgi:hypothetical protein